jgi:predicted transcriptional regulator
MNERRTHLDIIYDILYSIQQKGGKIKPTHLLYKSNLSHKRMTEYMKELQTKSLVEEEAAKNKKLFVITESGLKFLVELKKVKEFTDAFGL